MAAIREDRLVDTAVALVEVPSPTCEAGAVADRLASLLVEDGFAVERPVAAWPTAPAVVTRLDGGAPGPTLQFDGHLDTVHLPFVPPRVEGGILHGSGASDMKGGVAAMCEATRALRDAGALTAGSILLTAHDHHEAPWGDGRQLEALIDEGYVGDAALLPEYLSDSLPIAGRGLAILKVTVRRDGEPVHEVLGGTEQPSVIAAGAELVRRFEQLDETLSHRKHPVAGRERIFVGSVQAGEMYNTAPTALTLDGTRRWIPGTSNADVQQELDDLVTQVARERGLPIELAFRPLRGAFELDPAHPVVAAFQHAHEAVVGAALPAGPKPLVDDGNTFSDRAGIPAITHGPRATGAHTVDEQAPVSELVRVARIYARTALSFCAGPTT